MNQQIRVEEDETLLEIQVTYRIKKTKDIDDTPYVLEYDYINSHGGMNGDSIGYYNTYVEAYEALQNYAYDA